MTSPPLESLQNGATAICTIENGILHVGLSPRRTGGNLEGLLCLFNGFFEVNSLENQEIGYHETFIEQAYREFLEEASQENYAEIKACFSLQHFYRNTKILPTIHAVGKDVQKNRSYHSISLCALVVCPKKEAPLFTTGNGSSEQGPMNFYQVTFKEDDSLLGIEASFALLPDGSKVPTAYEYQATTVLNWIVHTFRDRLLPRPTHF